MPNEYSIPWTPDDEQIEYEVVAFCGCRCPGNGYFDEWTRVDFESWDWDYLVWDLLKSQTDWGRMTPIAW